MDENPETPIVDQTPVATGLSASQTAAHFSFYRFPSTYAHSVATLAMCEALETVGLRTTLFAGTNPERPRMSADSLLDEYGIETKPEVRWVKTENGKWRQRVLVFATTIRWAKRFDVCFTRNPLPAFACHLRKQTCYYEMHSPEIGVMDRTLVRAMRRSRWVRFVAISDAVANEVAADLGLDRSRIVIAHSGCKIAPAGQGSVGLPPHLEAHFDGPGPHAVFAGSFYKGRGVETIVELARRHPDVHFLAIGSTESSPAPTRDGERPSNLVILGHLPHQLVSGILLRADILLMPYAKRVTVNGGGDYLRYFSPLKMFEYLAAGKAIISSRSPSIEEILKDGENAIVLEPEDIDAWSAAIERLKMDPELRAELGRSAFETALGHTWEVRVRNILAEAGAKQG